MRPTGYHLSAYAVLLLASGAATVAAAFGVWRRGDSPGRRPLCVALLAAALWSVTYALELAADTRGDRLLWGSLKYLGVTVLPAAWLIFALQYTGRMTRVRSWLIAALAVEPVIVLTLLAVPATRHLVRYYPSGPLQAIPNATAGVVYWPHLVYTDALVLGASAILLTSVMGVSRLYWRQTITVVVAVCVPIIGSVMAAFGLPPFQQLDPDPLATSVAALVLVLGVLRYRLLDLRPIARSQVVDTMREAVLVVDAHGHVVDVNPAAEELLGRRAGAIVGCPAAELLAERAPFEEVPDPGVYDVRFAAGGREQDVELVVTSVADERGAAAGRVLVFRDVSERRELERDLRRLAYTDVLTGLPNRGLFHDRLEQALVSAHRHGTPLAVLFLDLDRFKVINDSLGHEIGDRMLVSVASRLRSCLRAEDTLARLGGDEFAVLLPEMGDRRDIAVVSDKLLSALSSSELIEGHELTVGASVGVAIHPDDGADVQHLLRSADAAMYRAKARGGGRAETFTRSYEAEIVRRHQLEVELRRGLRTGQLRVVFQPYRGLAEGDLAGFEALVRWDHPRDGLLGPASFLPLAEEIGLIDAVDRWILAEACRHAQEWPPQILLSVNVSAGWLRSGDVARQASDVLAETGLDPSRLILELNEHILFDDASEALDAVADLAGLGVGLAIDDFGAGYTSLDQLRRLPIGQLKIDRSLIAPLDASEEDTLMVRALVEFAHALDVSVVAEGIERRSQLARLTELGCDYGQGFLFSAPSAVPRFTARFQHVTDNQDWLRDMDPTPRPRRRA